MVIKIFSDISEIEKGKILSHRLDQNASMGMETQLKRNRNK